MATPIYPEYHQCGRTESHEAHNWVPFAHTEYRCEGYEGTDPTTADYLARAVEVVNRQEAVDHPAHYGGADNPYETIKVLGAWMTPEQLQGFCIGNAIKYVSRAGRKDPAREVEDLKKAAWYIDYAIELMSARLIPGA